MPTRNDPEINPAIRRELGEARAANATLRRQIDALRGVEPEPANEFDEKLDTAVRRMTEEARAVIEEARKQQPSYPGVNVTVELPRHRHDSSSPPSAPSLDAHIPLLGHWKAKGLKAIVAVLVVAALVVLAVAAVKSAAVGREVPAGRAKD